MDKENSILDKIIASKQMQDASQFIPSEFVSRLLKNLNNKEREILNKRFGLNGGNKQTLEEIGKSFDITRERIRQIQMTAIRKIKDLQELKTELESIESLISRLLEDWGGLMEENHLIENLLSYSDNSGSNRQAAYFILENLLDEKIDRISKNENLLPGWKSPLVQLEKAMELEDTIHDIIRKENSLLDLSKILKLLKGHDYHKEKNAYYCNYNDLNDEKLSRIVEAYLRASKKIDKNIMDEWGLKKWNTVKPKRMSDKVYMILRREKKPLHFKEIANLINQAKFDSKVAHPATIHNELILNDKFVLIGRGIYALAEWGYKPGTVADVIIDILKNSEKPLSKEEITNNVLKSRQVKKSTINLALTDREKFKKTEDSCYTLASK
ncbi:hypothetical protein C4569_00545 [Candidatus Parcubacteria bacterium]|nr:MAG: hypothetical protein C4569_00545 [Candidatus Parcubacteria bacterium]